jgi:hypothetical protein
VSQSGGGGVIPTLAAWHSQLLFSNSMDGYYCGDCQDRVKGAWLGVEIEERFLRCATWLVRFANEEEKTASLRSEMTSLGGWLWLLLRPVAQAHCQIESADVRGGLAPFFPGS